MSISGNLAMGLLRAFHPGKGSFSDLEKLKEKARRENEGFRFSFPKNRRAEYRLLPGTQRECLIIDPVKRKNTDKAILYIYGGVTNNWKLQRPMAVNLALRTGTEVWYPVYPAMSEVPVGQTVRYLTEIYRRMTETHDPAKIVISGVSMGGMFALQIIHAVNRFCPGLPMPGLVLAHSPGGWPEDEEGWDLYRAYEKRDPMFSEGDLRMTLNMTPAGESSGDRWLYPAQGDFRNAPPTYLYYGEEMLAGNAPLYQKAYEESGAGDRIRIRITKNMMHGYSCLPVFPESRRSYSETIRLIESL